ncbi:MAG: hypothetical protein AB7M05_05475 [Alphaproteobacteria bacterium]
MTAFIRLFALALLAAAFVAFGSAGVYAAKETTVRATAVWQGEGTAVRVGDKEALMNGVFEGAMFIEDNKGDLNMAKMICPVSMTIQPDGTQAGTGGCLLLGQDGDQVFAKWNCKGEYLKGCAGQFTLNGGTGKFKGITGGGQFGLRGTMQETMPGGPGVVTQTVIGLAVWPELKYKLP